MTGCFRGWVAGPQLGGSGWGCRCFGPSRASQDNAGRAPSVQKLGSFTDAASCIKPKEKLWEAEDGCKKWREGGGDTRAKVAAGS